MKNQISQYIDNEISHLVVVYIFEETEHEIRNKTETYDFRILSSGIWLCDYHMKEIKESRKERVIPIENLMSSYYTVQ